MNELCLQSWRMELDAGLGGSGEAEAEQLLIVAPTAALEQVVAEMEVDDDARHDGRLAALPIRVSVEGWNQGCAAVGDGAPLRSWRALRPRVVAAS